MPNNPAIYFSPLTFVLTRIIQKSFSEARIEDKKVEDLVEKFLGMGPKREKKERNGAVNVAADREY